MSLNTREHAVPVLFSGGGNSPKLPLTMGGFGPPTNAWLLGPTAPHMPNAISTKPVVSSPQGSRSIIPILYYGTAPTPPQNCALIQTDQLSALFYKVFNYFQKTVSVKVYLLIFRQHRICVAYRCDLLLVMFMVCESVCLSVGHADVSWQNGLTDRDAVWHVAWAGPESDVLDGDSDLPGKECTMHPALIVCSNPC